MTTNQDLQKNLEEQRKLGFPDFKNKIVDLLVLEHQLETEEARKLLFKTDIEDLIDEDIYWAQHMGPDYWAGQIAELHQLNK